MRTEAGYLVFLHFPHLANWRKVVYNSFMKIILVNTVYGQGSVGRITADLYERVEACGNQAVVAYGRGSAPTTIASYKIGNSVDFYRHVCRNFFRGEGGFGSEKQTKRFLEFLEREQPDVLHLHNLHGFYLQIELLFDWIKSHHVPVVWTFHDCWSFTGHCAYYEKNECMEWQKGCSHCPYHRSAYPYALFRDNAANAFVRKKAAFTGVENLRIVTPSEWLAEQVRSSFLGEYPVQVIPNGINLSVFALREDSCTFLPKKKRFQVLGVANIWEERKGLAYFVKLAEQLPGEYQIRLIGLSKSQQRKLEGQFDSDRLLAEGRTESIEELAEAYRQADVFVNPTLEDNFPTANLEALACGTPVVTFETGGSPETIGLSVMGAYSASEEKAIAGEMYGSPYRYSSCGISVEKNNAEVLECAVREVCESSRFSQESCRRQAEQFDKAARYGQYLALYEQIV